MDSSPFFEHVCPIHFRPFSLHRNLHLRSSNPTVDFHHRFRLAPVLAPVTGGPLGGPYGKRSTQKLISDVAIRLSFPLPLDGLRRLPGITGCPQISMQVPHRSLTEAVSKSLTSLRRSWEPQRACLKCCRVSKNCVPRLRNIRLFCLKSWEKRSSMGF